MTALLDMGIPPIDTDTMNNDDLARFVQKHYRPEVWRSEVPLIVKVLCKGHPERLAVWLSISWLLDFYQAEGRDGFGTREIAKDSGVGRNRISRYVGELADLGLLEIVGYEEISGKNPKGLRPRPRYDINWAALEQRSLLLLPEKICEHGIRHPPVITHPPEQMSLNLEVPGHMGETHFRSGDPALSIPEPSDAPVPEVAQMRDSLAPVYASSSLPLGQPDKSVPGVALQRDSSVQQAYSASPSPEVASVSNFWHTTVPGAGTENGQYMPASGTGAVQDCHSSVPLEREKEGTKEREKEQLTPADIRLLATETARAVALELFQHLPTLTLSENNPAPASITPSAPAGHPELPAPVLELWGADRGHVAQRDIFQLDSLAAEYDLVTDGYGAYWLGQALLMAERCLENKGQRPTVSYVRAILKRWAHEGSWGSDIDEQEPAAGNERGAGNRPEIERTRRNTPAPTQTPDPESQAASTPAVEQYTHLTGQQPNAVQVDAIAQTVTDLDAWRRVIIDWQAHGWNVANVADMLDRYRRQTGTAPQEERVSELPIIMHPDLQDEERDEWLYRFRRANSATEKRAILDRLKREHPLDDEEAV